MNEIKKEDMIELKEYGVKVNPYLTYAQIQQIVDSTLKFDSWAERQQNIDMLMLLHATDIGGEALEEMGHEMALESGLICAVAANIVNLSQIHQAITYTESTPRALAQIIKQLPKYFEPLQKVIEKNGKSSIHQ